MKKFLTILGFLALSASLVFVVSWGQEFVSNQSLEVSPASQEFKVDPGQNLKIKAKVRNKSKITLPIKVRVEDFTASGEEGQVALTNKTPYSVVNWAKVTPSSFTLAPGEDQEVTADIVVPRDAAGGRYGSFVFAISPGTGDQKSVAKIAQEIGSLFLLRVSGPVNEQLVISKFSAPEFSEYGPVPFTLKFTNTGNIHVRVFGLVNVTDMFGKRTADIVVSGTNIFPGADRVFYPVLDKKILFGHYTGLAVMNFGSKNESLTAQTSFWVIPIKLIAAVFVVLLVLYLIRKRLKKAMRVLFER